LRKRRFVYARRHKNKGKSARKANGIIFLIWEGKRSKPGVFHRQFGLAENALYNASINNMGLQTHEGAVVSNEIGFCSYTGTWVLQIIGEPLHVGYAQASYYALATPAYARLHFEEIVAGKL
jgi:hypothetical protein